jgi:hypothetical protein
MRAIIGWGTAFLCSGVGWWLGEKLGLAMAVIVSSIAGGVGLYFGNRWFDDNLG